MYSTDGQYILMTPRSIGGGTEIRIFKSLKELLTDTMLNRGEEVAFWAEKEGARCAGVWRKQAAEDAVKERELAEAMAKGILVDVEYRDWDTAAQAMQQ